MKRPGTRTEFHSVAEPLSDDDFDVEVKQAARTYAEAQRQLGRREQVRLENVERKKRGEAPVPLPRLAKLKRELRDSSDDGGASSFDDASDDGTEAKRKRLKQDDELQYEGQVRLDFNPLYRLAGIPDPDDTRAADIIKHDLLERLSGGQKLHGGTLGNSPPAPSVTPSSPDGYHCKSSLQNTDENEEAEACEGDYEEEDANVIVPWGNAASNGHDDVGMLFEEGEYSDDELFPDHVDEPTLPVKPTDEVPSYRPHFPFSQEQSTTGPHALDQTTPDILIPAPINRFLKGYQRTGTEFLYRMYSQNRGAILGDDMGLGKTIQVIAFLSAIMRKTGTSADFQRRKKYIRQSGSDLNPKHWPTALIVCPKSLIGNWARELDTWGYFEYAIWSTETWADTRASFLKGFLDIILVSYDTARNTIDQLKDLPMSAVIADEAHRLKEPRAQSTLALKKLNCRICFALTGTLIQNRIDEMWSVLDFVHRGWAGSLKEWRKFAVNPIKRGHRYEGTAEEVVTAIKRLGLMYERILPHFYLRRDKRLIAHELPEKRDMVVFCPLARRQIIAYRALIDSEDVQFLLKRNDPCSCGSGEKRSSCCHGTTSNGETVRDVLLKNLSALQKVANHLGLLYHAKDDSVHTRQVNEHFFEICMGESYNAKQHNVVEAALDPDNCGKWTLLEEMLIQWRQDATNNKVLVFSNSVRLLKMIAEFISTSSSLAGFAFDMLTGEAGNAERMDMVDRFQDQSKDHFVFLISTLAGGVGLNLTAANKVVIFDPDWNPANDLQAMDRAFRIGQKRTVDVYRLIAQGTLEELKYERQIHKQQRSRQFNDGTFERRLHSGYDGARTKEDQGELFGAHNIFRFEPKGFVPGNLERIRVAEDRFVQDLIDAEYNNFEAEDDSDDDTGRKMRDERRARDVSKAVRRREGEKAVKAEKRRDALMDEILGEDVAASPRKQDDVLGRLGVTVQEHSQAFRDSPEERQIYEIGVKLLRDNPQLAKTIKANDLGRLGRSVSSSAKREKPKGVEVVDEEPWKKRLEEKKKRGPSNRILAELSD